MTVFRKVKLAERAPSLQDFMKYQDCSIVFIYKDGIKEFWSHDTFIDIPKESELIEYWLEEVELPSGQDIYQAAKEDAQEMWGNLHDTMIPGSIRSVGESNEIGFITGCDFIMNKIIL